MRYVAEITLRTDPIERDSKEEVLVWITDDYAEATDSRWSKIVEVVVTELEDIDP